MVVIFHLLEVLESKHAIVLSFVLIDLSLKLSMGNRIVAELEATHAFSTELISVVTDKLKCTDWGGQNVAVVLR